MVSLLRRSSLLLGAAAVGFTIAAALVAGRSGAFGPGPVDMQEVRKVFARPTAVPHPPDNPPSPEKIALGERLFSDPQLSVDGSTSCASCHDPRLSFTDGVPLGEGVSKRPLKRHTPTLWNLAWAPTLFWDGRVDSLEAQAKVPIEHPDEMGANLEDVAARLARDPAYREAFRVAFPSDPTVSAANILKALAVYERTLVSPPTRFDQWIVGDDGALTAQEKAGFSLFIGKARCVSCHSGFAFTDHSFHDIGLPTDDLGRGPVLGVPEANHAFKTPGLRELAWTAPYMHDGSLATLEDVVRHYESGGIDRPSRSADMPAGLDLTDDERAALIAFLYSLSSDTPPKPSTEPWVAVARDEQPDSTAAVRGAAVISQRNKQFSPGHVVVRAGEPVTILNDDTRTHNVRIFDPRFDFNSGAQEPGESISLRLPLAGTYNAFCGIHPTMRLTIEVE